MKKYIIIAAIAVSLTSCQKDCYRFIIKEHTVSKNGLNVQDKVTYESQCDLTARQARKYAESKETEFVSNGVTTTITARFEVE